jgi:hypothetical protein
LYQIFRRLWVSAHLQSEPVDLVAVLVQEARDGRSCGLGHLARFILSSSLEVFVFGTGVAAYIVLIGYAITASREALKSLRPYGPVCRAFR